MAKMSQGNSGVKDFHAFYSLTEMTDAQKSLVLVQNVVSTILNTAVKPRVFFGRLSRHKLEKG